MDSKISSVVNLNSQEKGLTRMKTIKTLTSFHLFGLLWVLLCLPLQQEVFGQQYSVLQEVAGNLKIGGTTTITLSIRTASNTLTAATATTTFTVSCTDCPVGGSPVFGGASLTGGNTLTILPGASSITFTYTNTKVGTGTHTIRVQRATGDTFTFDSNNLPVTVEAGDPYSFQLTTASSSIAAGVASGPITLTLYDVQGHVAKASGSTVSFSLTTSGTGTPTFTTSPVSIAVGQSTATFTYANQKSGSYIITATQGGGAALTVATNTLTMTVSPGTYSKIGITSSNNSPVAGSTVTLNAKLKDQYDNDVTTETKTINWSQSGPGNYSSNSGSTSSGSASTSFTTIGTISTTIITAQDAANASISSTLTLSSIPGAAASITVQAGSGQTATVTTQLGIAAGTATPTVIIKDANSNLVTGATVTFNPVSGSTATTTTTTDANGVATTTWTLGTVAGTQTLQVSTPGVSPINITATALADTDNKYIITPATTSPVAGTNVLITAQLTDTHNNSVSTAGRVVTWTKSDANGSFSLASSTTNSSGVATVTFTSHTVVGTPTSITGTDNNTTPRAGSSAVITTVSAGAASALHLNTQPGGGQPSGSLLTPQPVIHIRDAGGNLVNTATNTVSVSLVGAGTLGGTTSVAAVGGVATFTNLTLAGTVSTTYQLTFSSSGLGSITSNNVAVTPGTASKLVVTTAPVAGASGAALTTQPVIEVRDAQDNLVTGDNATIVSIAITAGTGGTLGGTTTKTVTNGVATFTGVTLTGTQGAAYTLGFSSTPTLTTASSAVTLGTGSATQLGVAQAAVAGASGQALTTQPIIHVRDPLGSLVTSGTYTVTVSITPSTATFTGITSVASSNGIATFSGLTMTGTPGNYTLNFTATPTLMSTTSTVTLTAGAANKLAITTQPVAGANGAVLTTAPVIEIRDANNNIVSTATNTITASISAGGTVTGTIAVAAINGVATFSNLILNGLVNTNYTLTFASGSLTSITSNNVTFSGPGAANKLAITRQPVGGNNGEVLATQPIVEIQDAQGNRITNSTALVSAALGSGTDTGNLGGAKDQVAVAGVATYQTLTLSGIAGTNYSIQFTSTGLTTVTSTNITVTSIPTVSTASVTTFTSSTATLGGNVTAQGSSALNQKGVCYSTATNPSLSSTNTQCVISPGTATGTFTVPVTGLSVSTKYYVRAYATNTQGTAYGANVEFTTTALENAIPTVISISPDLGAPGQTVEVTITGTNFATGATIESLTGITISNVSRVSASSITARFAIASTATLGARLVKVTNPSPGGGTSATSVDFYVALAPPSPNSTKWPTGGIVSTSSTPTFEWIAVSGATNYTIQVSNQSNFTQSQACEITCEETEASNFVNTYSNITGTSFLMPTALQAGLTYYWRIRANTAQVNGLWSAPISFQVIAPPNPPGLISPSNNASGLTGSVVLQWTPTTNTNTYQLQVSTLITFASPYVDQPTLNSSAFTMPAFSAGNPVEYYWRVRSIGVGGTSNWSDTYRYTRARLTSDPDEGAEIPTTFSLEQNYPNPFNPSTNIRFGLPETAPVTLEVYNLQGQKVAVLLQNVTKSAGMHTLSFDASKLSSGIYVYRIIAGSSFMASHKMVLLK